MAVDGSLSPLIIIKGISRIYLGSAEQSLSHLLAPYGKVVVLTNERVAGLYGHLVGEYPQIILPEGEASKSLETVTTIYRELMRLGADRHTFILALGGGILCDMAGFAASTYMRGVRFGYLPTTLLAQVDASVGGKTGVNLDGYKNMVGTFSQPQFVLCDAALLASLPQREFCCGLAEVIKMAILGDEELFGLLEQRTLDEIRSDRPFTEWMIGRCIQQKAAIVERDEREAGERRLLNLGHTFAHAIEHCNPAFHHGEAVGVGLVMASEVARQRGELPLEEATRIRALVEKMQLPTSVDLGGRRIIKKMRQDKNSKEEQIAWILPSAIGRCRVERLPLEAIFNEE